MEFLIKLLNVISFNDVHFEKHPFPIVFTDVGIFISEIEEHQNSGLQSILLFQEF